MKCLNHDYKPSYWRSAFPDYKVCSICSAVKSGTEEEKKLWAENSPYLREMEEAAIKNAANFGEAKDIYSTHGKLKTDGKWTAIGKAFFKWVIR